MGMSGFNYTNVHRPGTSQGNADGLSRLPLLTTLADTPQPAETVLLYGTVKYLFGDCSTYPVMDRQRSSFGKGSEGWPEVAEEALTPYFKRKGELSAENGCILWGARVVVPLN